MKDGKYNYLAIAPASSCADYIKSDTDCTDNMAILQPTKNKFCSFQLQKKFGETKYTLINKLNDVGVNLNQLLNVANINRFVCFGFADGDSVYFELDETNAGEWVIKFRKNTSSDVQNPQYTYFYICECVANNAICKQGTNVYKRVCVDTDKTKAIHFEIECDKNENFTDVSDQYTNSVSVKDNTSIIPNASVYSLNNSLSDTQTTLSLPGAEASQYEHFMEL
jgi:hypothetical protein